MALNPHWFGRVAALSPEECLRCAAGSSVARETAREAGPGMVAVRGREGAPTRNEREVAWPWPTVRGRGGASTRNETADARKYRAALVRENGCKKGPRKQSHVARSREARNAEAHVCGGRRKEAQREKRWGITHHERRALLAGTKEQPRHARTEDGGEEQMPKKQVLKKQVLK